MSQCSAALHERPPEALKVVSDQRLTQVGSAAMSAYDLLLEPLERPERLDVSFVPNPDYERYLLIHKVIVGRVGAQQLEHIHESLAQETMPRYLSAAGWAAVEAAVSRNDLRTGSRLNLLGAGVECWQRAIRQQRVFNEYGPDYLEEHTAPYRMALDMAVSPLLKGLILGDVTEGIRRESFEACLNVAQANAVRLRLAIRDKDVEAIADHLGFGYECNALLLLNLQSSPTRFVIPGMNRADSGYHHRDQTHDLSIVHQKWGDIRFILPAEIKASASARDRRRYRALLIRGKMHLSVPGKYSPIETLRAVTAVYEGNATKEDTKTVNIITDRLTRMIRDYRAGECLGNVATKRSVTSFRDSSLVVARHPGLSCVRA